MKKVYSLTMFYEDNEYGPQEKNWGLYSSKKKAKKAKKKIEEDYDKNFPDWRDDCEFYITWQDVL